MTITDDRRVRHSIPFDVSAGDRRYYRLETALKQATRVAHSTGRRHQVRISRLQGPRSRPIFVVQEIR